MRNWAGNHAYSASRVHRPRTLEELREVVRGAERIKPLGSRHTFNDIGDAPELVSLEALPYDVAIGDGVVEVGGAVRYGDLARELDAAGLALHNLASLPHISVAGAVATATHGSGTANLAAAVGGLELVTSDGELRRLGRGDADFAGAVVGLGALGVVTRLTLDVQPAFRVRQTVFEGVGWAPLLAGFDAVMAAGYSVSVFHTWGEATDQVWVKVRDGEPVPESLLGTPAATAPLHPIAGMDPVNSTEQLGVPGPWFERLPHFRMGFTPSSGEELQSEYFVATARAPEAVEALRAIGDELRPLTQVSELRTIRADGLWLSPQYGRDSVGIHFTWIPDQPRVMRALDAVETALAPFDARPHWGKLFLEADHPRRSDFARLRERLDPRGAFVNPWLERHVL